MTSMESAGGRLRSLWIRVRASARRLHPAMRRRPQEPDSQETDTLDCWLAGNPIRVREMSDWERLRQWSRQRPAAARVVAASAFATILVAAVSTALLFSVSAARQQTERALTSLEQTHARAQLELRATETLVRQHERDHQRATEACQTALSKLTTEKVI